MSVEPACTLFNRATKLEDLTVPPIWMMRQAGRYHAHYQALRKKHSFMDLCKVPELAAEVAMGPIRDFDFDAAILFSDLLFPLQALGMPLVYDPGPQLGWNLSSLEQIKNFKPASQALEQLQFQASAVRATRALLPRDKSLIGFVGGPWTLFVYAVQGSHKGGLENTFARQDIFESFCDVMVPLLQKKY